MHYNNYPLILLVHGPEADISLIGITVLWWQRLATIFKIGHVYVIYFDMTALSGWQLNIIMSSFIPTPYETRSD